MIILEDLNTPISVSRPCVLTIGNFDGVHLGHQALLKHMREIAGTKGTLCLLTFSNHPSYILPGKTPIEFISSKSLKMRYLEQCGIDVVYCLEFTPELAQMRYDAFIQSISRSCPFDVLILGEGDAFGYKREGTAEKMKQLSAELGFNVEYLPKLMRDAETISSGKIRKCIRNGEIGTATALLGHPYVVEGAVESDQLLLAPHLCLPPDGDYKVVAEFAGEKKHALAHISAGKIKLDISAHEKKISILFQ